MGDRCQFKGISVVIKYTCTGYLQSCSANYDKNIRRAEINQSPCTIFLRMCRMQFKHRGVSCTLGFWDDACLEALHICLRFMNVYMSLFTFSNNGASSFARKRCLLTLGIISKLH